MTKKSVKAELNGFIKGLITEASPLNFPENASIDEENFELSRKGTRSRRLGMALEPGAFMVNSNVTTESIVNTSPVAFQWNGAGGDEERVFLVTQFENRLSFFDMQKEPISDTGFLVEIVLTGFPTAVQYSFAVIDGSLVVAAGIDIIAIIVYEEGVFHTTYERITVRDVWGIEESITQYETDPSFRGGIDSFHYYNLLNQSWGIPRKRFDGVVVDPAWSYFADGEDSVWPSNSEVVWPGLQYQPVAASQQPFERLYLNLYKEVLGANVKAPKGYFVIDLLRRGQSRAQAVLDNYAKYPELIFNAVTTPSDFTPGGAKIVADFAGRIFYAGFNGEVIGGDARSPNLSNYIFFSKLIRNRTDFTKCYQEGDPTSRENSEVVDTDGGGIRISGMETVIGMVNLSTHLILIATNGVWAITGGGDYGFTPTNIKVDKLSTFGGVSRFAIVEHFGRVFFWGEGGIYVVAKNEFGDFVVTNITENTIQSLYDSIDSISKRNAVGVYDDFNKKIRWIYKTGTKFTSTSVTRELIFDTVLNAFYKFRIYNDSINSTEVICPIPWIGYRAVDVVNNIIIGSDTVVVNGDQVVINDFDSANGLLDVRYLTVSSNASFSFSYYRDEEFRDWPHVGTGVDAFAYMETGETTGGDSSLPKQIPYVTIHFYRTEENVDDITLQPLKQSGCLMRFKWEFSDTSESRKWSRLTQVYRYRRPRLVESVDDTYDTGFQLITTKNKIRGRGKSFRMYIETEPFKDCQVVGWNLAANANSIT